MWTLTPVVPAVPVTIYTGVTPARGTLRVVYVPVGVGTIRLSRPGRPEVVSPRRPVGRL